MAKAQRPKQQNQAPKSTVIPTPKTYCAFIYLNLEPLQKNIHVADYIYTESTNEVSFFDRNPSHSSALEGLMQGDISVVDSKSGAVTMVSRHEQTLQWIKMLHKAKEFSGNPYVAGIPIEDYETG